MISKWLQRGLALAGVAIGAGCFYWFHYESGIEWTVASVQEFVADLGPAGPLILIAMMAMRPFLALPSAAILLAAGFLFGPVVGTVYGAVGGTLGALIALGIARGLGRDAVQSRLGATLQTFDEYLSKRGAPWLALYTALPFSVLSPVYFTAGVTRMAVIPFATSIALGFLPRASFYTVLGDVVNEPSAGNVTAAVVLALLLAVGLWVGRRYLFPPRTPVG